MRIVPWITDTSIEFLLGYLESFARKHGRLPDVLEFGMGASTLFFLGRSRRLVSFEHDPAWHAKITSHAKLERSAPVEFHRLDRPYSRFVAEKVASATFDIVMIDGRDRVACLEECLDRKLVSDGGIFVLDNMERVSGEDGRYRPMLEALEKDYDFIHFEQSGRDRSGWVPGHRWVTTVACPKSHGGYTTLGQRL